MNDNIFVFYIIHITQKDDTERAYGITMEVISTLLPQIIDAAVISGNVVEIIERREIEYEEK